jgi:branched-chain amino acid transport system substrate-binding protein
MKAALEQAASTDSAAVISAMTAIKVDGLTGTGISFTAAGEPEKAAKFIQIVDGEYTVAK